MTDAHFYVPLQEIRITPRLKLQYIKAMPSIPVAVSISKVSNQINSIGQTVQQLFRTKSFNQVILGRYLNTSPVLIYLAFSKLF
jgi:hypothetical protein